MVLISLLLERLTEIISGIKTSKLDGVFHIISRINLQFQIEFLEDEQINMTEPDQFTIKLYIKPSQLTRSLL